jgi:single-strand DNA-binding protein
MARGVNKVILIGNLGADPEVKQTAGGTTVCKMAIAVNESYKDASGEWQERTEWINLVAWARLAEVCGEYLTKGSQIYVEGSLNTRKYETNGETKYFTEVKISEMQMLGSKGEGGGGGGQAKQQPKQQQQYRQPAQQQRGVPASEVLPQMEDDLPF